MSFASSIPAHREKGTCSNASQISVDQLERRVLAGIKKRLMDPDLLAEFVSEFHSEFEQIQASSRNSSALSGSKLDDVARKIDRIVNAITEGTDTPTLRQTLLTLEDEKAELENTFNASCSPISAEPPTRPALAALFRRKVERLEEALNGDLGITSAAAPILRSLIDAIILYPRGNKGSMRIEVHGEPSTLFLPADGDASDEKNWMITVVAEEGLEPPTRGL